jgi:exonuclease VII large subunit
MIDREFSGVNQEGFDVSGVVKQAFDSCFRKMSSQVTNDLNAAARDDGTASSTGSATNPNSMVVNAQQQFTALERQKLAEMNQVLTSYQQAYQNATQSLTLARMEMPIDPACRTSVSRAASCIEKMQAGLNGVVRGEGHFGSVMIPITGTDPKHKVNLVCKGLRGCAADMDRFIRNRTQHIQQVGAMKQNYVQQARQSMETLKGQVRQAVEPRIKDLQTKLQSIQAALGAAGAQDLDLNFGSMPTEDVQYDENGLPRMPNNMMAFLMNGIGGVNGPPNISSSALAQVESRINATLSERQSEMTTIAQVMQQVESKLRSCPMEAARSALTRVQSSYDQYNAGNCRMHLQHCGSQRSALDSFTTSLTSLRERVGITFIATPTDDGGAEAGSDAGDIESIIAGIDTGMAGMCDPEGMASEATQEDVNRMRQICRGERIPAELEAEYPTLDAYNARLRDSNLNENEKAALRQNYLLAKQQACSSAQSFTGATGQANPSSCTSTFSRLQTNVRQASSVLEGLDAGDAN